MNAERRAVIDVGTNSVKLLVADVSEGQARPVLEQSRQTRLGKNFYAARRLQADAITQTARAVADFAKAARDRDSISIRVIATSAARDAVNARDLVSAVKKASGLNLEIISGDTEAEWAFQGAASGTDLGRSPLLLLDVGGGSTEFIIGHGGHKSFARSFPLGTVRLLEQTPNGDPPAPEEFKKCSAWIKDFLREQVRPDLEPVLRRERNSGEVRLAGTGGTATILARMELKSDRFDREQIESVRLKLVRIRSLGQTLWSLPLAQRKQIPGLPRSRADVILTGILIYESVMEEFGFGEFRVSTGGLRFAAVMAP